MHARTPTRTHTPVTYQGNQGYETEEKAFRKRMVFKEGLKELTEVEWRTETGSWFQITGAMSTMLDRRWHDFFFSIFFQKLLIIRQHKAVHSTASVSLPEL